MKVLILPGSTTDNELSDSAKSLRKKLVESKNGEIVMATPDEFEVAQSMVIVDVPGTEFKEPPPYAYSVDGETKFCVHTSEDHGTHHDYHFYCGFISVTEPLDWKFCPNCGGRIVLCNQSD